MISIFCLLGSFSAFACGDGAYLVEPDRHWIFYTGYNSADLQDLLRYIQFLKSGGKTAAEKFVIQNNYRDLNFYYELIATKLMRVERYDSALVYLKRVSPKFLRTQNIYTEIDSEHNPFTEGWITRKEQQAKFRLPFNPAKAYADNPGKATFCKVMLKLQHLMKNAKSEEERANAAYAYGLVVTVSSLEKESLHDFAQALADLGVQNAIYLVGADAYGFCRTQSNDTTETTTWGARKTGKTFEKVNFIVWRAVE